MAEDSVIYYFSFGNTVEENVSQELLTTPPGGQQRRGGQQLLRHKAYLFRSFVSALRAKDTSIPEWPVDCADSEGRALFESILKSVFAKGSTVVYDEIQAHPHFTRALLRVLAGAKTDPNDRLRLCRLALIGTPPSVLSADALDFAVDEINKVDFQITIGPLTIESFIRAIEQAIGYLPGMELLVLWTVTGGIARHLQSLLSSIASSYANKENTARSFRAPQYIAIKRWLQLRTSNMSAELRSLEWQFLRNITSTQSRGAAIPSTPILESLLTKNVEVAPLYTDLYQVDVASYTVNNSYIRAIARSLTMLHQAPKQLVMDLCDFGLKDFVEKLLTDCRRQAESNGEEADNDDDDTDDDEDCQSHNTPQWAPDPRILAAARLMSLSYDDFDIDLVLQKEETRRGVHLLFGSFKLNEKEMSPPSIKAFCDKNVTKFLTTKIPDGIKVLSVHIIGLAVGIRMDNCSVRENWMKSAKQLEATISIPCSGDLWSFDDMIRPLRTIDVDDSPFPLADATSLRNAWSTVDRREDAADAVEILQGGGSIIVRGYAGVGKTTIFKEIVMPALESRGDVHYIDGFQLVSDQ